MCQQTVYKNIINAAKAPRALAPPRGSTDSWHVPKPSALCELHPHHNTARLSAGRQETRSATTWISTLFVVSKRGWPGSTYCLTRREEFGRVQSAPASAANARHTRRCNPTTLIVHSLGEWIIYQMSLAVGTYQQLLFFPEQLADKAYPAVIHSPVKATSAAAWWKLDLGSSVAVLAAPVPQALSSPPPF